MSWMGSLLCSSTFKPKPHQDRQHNAAITGNHPNQRHSARGLVKLLLFNVMTEDITHICHPKAVKYVYADGMILGSTDKEELQSSINNWTKENDLDTNLLRMVLMVFRKGTYPNSGTPHYKSFQSTIQMVQILQNTHIEESISRHNSQTMTSRTSHNYHLRQP